MSFKGSLFLVQYSPNGSTYNTVAEARSNGLTINNTLVDITNKGSAGFRTALAGAGTCSMSVSLEGTWEDSGSGAAIQAAAISGDFVDLKLISGAGDTFTGDFAVTNFGRSGTFNGEEAFTASLESAGAITYAPAS